MNTHKKKQIQAIENRININHFDGSFTDELEPLSGDSTAPMLVPVGYPDPTFNDLYAENDTLVTSSRLNRIARQMVKNGFKGD